MIFEMEMIDETERNCEHHLWKPGYYMWNKMTGKTKANQNTTYKSHEIKCELEMTDNVETHNGHHLWNNKWNRPEK